MTRKQMEQAVTEYSDMLYRLAFVRTGNAEDAEDIVQQAFLKLVEHPEVLTDKEHTKAWLIRVCCNDCINLLKSSRKNKEIHSEDILLFCAGGSCQEESVLKKLQREQLWREVYRLPEEYRVVLHLCYMEEYTPKEIAAVLHVNYNLVCVRLNRAKKKLAQRLKKEDFYD